MWGSRPARGWTLEQTHQKLSESRRAPDAVIIYAGHNEFASASAGRRTSRITWTIPVTRCRSAWRIHWERTRRFAG